jgi:hypothetical protein
VDAEYFQACFFVVQVHFLGVYLQRFLSILLCFVDLPTLLLDVGQLVIAFGVLLVLVYLLEIIILGVFVFVGDEMHVSLIFDVAHEFGAVLIVDEGVLFVGGQCGFGFVEQVEDSAILEMDHDISKL